MNKKALDDYETLEWDSAKRTLLAGAGLRQEVEPGNAPDDGAHVRAPRRGLHRRLQRQAEGAAELPARGGDRSDDPHQQGDVDARAGRGLRAGRPRRCERRRRPTDRRRAAAGPGRGRRAAAAAAVLFGRVAAAGARRSWRRSRRRRRRSRPRTTIRSRICPARINVLECPTKDETPPDRSVLIRCALAPNLPVTKLFLLYLEPGNDDFTPVQMEKTPKGWYAAKIPKKAVTGTSLRFYVEGRNDKGKAIVSNGRVDSPNVMLIREKEAAETEKELGGTQARKEENPLDEPDPTRPRRFLGRIDKSKIGLDTRYGNRQWWIGFVDRQRLRLRAGRRARGAAAARSRATSPASRGRAAVTWRPRSATSSVRTSRSRSRGATSTSRRPAHFSQYAATGAQAVLVKLYVYTQAVARPVLRQRRGRRRRRVPPDRVARAGLHGARASPERRTARATSGWQRSIDRRSAVPELQGHRARRPGARRRGRRLPLRDQQGRVVDGGDQPAGRPPALRGDRRPQHRLPVQLRVDGAAARGSAEEPVSKPKAKTTEVEPKRPKPKRPAQQQDDE